jgi:haloacetate dehalogenase
MAGDMVYVMEQLGFPQFSVAGHDRGGRVAYRMAIDHPEHVQRLAVLDILPTSEVWDRADKNFAESFWPWSLLSQPEPLPEKLIAGAADAIIDNALTDWGTSGFIFTPQIRAAYIEALRSNAHAICEDSRAAATIDDKHDREGHRIQCPVLALWSANGPLNNWYKADGGPLAIWRKWADNVQGWPSSGGHFFPEEVPAETANALIQFFTTQSSSHSLQTA